jgi:hypothetical protein
MVAADRPVRKRTPGSDLPPLSHRRGATALSEAVDRAAMLPPIDRSFERVERKRDRVHAVKPKVVVVLGIMGCLPVAGTGVAWNTLQHLIALRRLGYDVYYVEATAVWPFNATTDDCTFPVTYISNLLNRFGFENKWAYVAAHSDNRCYGLSELQVKDLYARADAIINLFGGTILRDEHMRCPIRIYLETDPVVHQLRIANGEQRYIDLVAAHTALFTWGTNYGASDCGVPLQSFEYKPTRSPVLLDCWESPCNPATRYFTTIGHWDQSVKDLEYNGERYSWSKHREFLKVLELPRRTTQEFSLALAIDDPATVQMLEGYGWHVEDAYQVSETMESYREYVWGSRGELTVAKDMNVRLRSGWFSERSACYLAAGKPVITQETGFSKSIPTGLGLYAFQKLEDIPPAIEAINSDYPRHSQAAKAIAAEYFDAEKLLRQVMIEAGL